MEDAATAAGTPADAGTTGPTACAGSAASTVHCTPPKLHALPTSDPTKPAQFHEMAARNVSACLRKQLHRGYRMLRFHGGIGRSFHRAECDCRLFLVWCCDGARPGWNARIPSCTQLCVSDICTPATATATTFSVARATPSCATCGAWAAFYAAT